jgi:hypothetical protein
LTLLVWFAISPSVKNSKVLNNSGIILREKYPKYSWLSSSPHYIL